MNDPSPPRRVDFDLGKDGRRAYHTARAAWYKDRTGHALTGSTAKQEEQYDNACRFLRAREHDLCKGCKAEARVSDLYCRECLDELAQI